MFRFLLLLYLEGGNLVCCVDELKMINIYWAGFKLYPLVAVTVLWYGVGETVGMDGGREV